MGNSTNSTSKTHNPANTIPLALNPMAYTAMIASTLSGIKGSPAELLAQTELLIAQIVSGDTSVLENYAASVSVTRAIAEQAFLLRAVTATSTAESLAWLAAANRTMQKPSVNSKKSVEQKDELVWVTSPDGTSQQPFRRVERVPEPSVWSSVEHQQAFAAQRSGLFKFGDAFLLEPALGVAPRLLLK